MTEVPTTSGSTHAEGNGCVYVVGMHRSGTSAVAGLLAELGLESPPIEDQIRATPSNLQGHFESRRLVAFNHRVLVRLGGTWTSPPVVSPGWEDAGELAGLRDEGWRLFRTTFPTRPAVWKDPRLCLLLPFWDTVVGPPSAAVFVWRDPHEVAMSLKGRDGLGALHAHALWERYVRRASADLDGLPVLVADYGRIVADPVDFCHVLVDFLSGVGVELEALGPDRLQGLIDATMRRHRVEDHDAEGLGASSRHIAEVLGDLNGPHAWWRPPAFGEEPGWVSDVLSMRSELDSFRRSLHWIDRSRAYRLAGWARRRRRSA